MQRYQIMVTQIVSDEELHREDREDNPSGEHFVLAQDAEDALDKFHATVPISNLGDFEIEVLE